MRYATHLWLLVLAILHHIVNMAQDSVYAVFVRSVEGEEGY